MASRGKRVFGRLRYLTKEHRFWRSLWWDMSPFPVIRAHDHCHRNREELLRSSACGCFYCLGVYAPSRIEKWVNDPNNPTALCPECGIDAVIGSESGYAINVEFMREMRAYWFREISFAYRERRESAGPKGPA